jgi:HlyD family secretion protein
MRGLLGGAASLAASLTASLTACLTASLLIISAAHAADARSVSSLGRIEPHDGVYQLAGPSEISVVAELRVQEGEMVAKGDVLATLDTYPVNSAEEKRAEVDLDLASRVLERNSALKQSSFQSEAKLDEAARDVQVRQAELTAARAKLAYSSITAPVAGQVLAIHAREGERIGLNGLLELGQTERMYVVAEVYETDIGLVDVGQAATATSPALPGPITGKVERIGKIVAKNDVLDLDPVARMDSRVVEVFILLDEPEVVASLTNLQVDVEITN